MRFIENELLEMRYRCDKCNGDCVSKGYYNRNRSGKCFVFHL